MSELIPTFLVEALTSSLRNPTRCRIFTELLLVGELSASALAQKLDLDLNVVAHHLRRLASTGIIVVARQRPYRGGVSQKYYRVARSLSLSLQARPQELAATARQATGEERYGIYVAYLLLAANIMWRALDRYNNPDPHVFDSLFLNQPLGTVAFGWLPRPALAELAQIVRNYLEQHWASGSAGGPEAAAGDFVVFAALPEFRTPES